MKGPGGDCNRPGLWPTTDWVADMTDRTCDVPGCPNPRRGRQLLCSKHYQQHWRNARSCQWLGCDEPRAAKGLCGLHYHRQRTGAEMDAPQRNHRAGTECSLPDCHEPHHADGLCGKHGQRRRRTGDPYGRRRIPAESCSVGDCTSPHMGLGMCRRHYKINERYGSPEPVYACRACGAPFEPASGQAGTHGGSYIYCPPCAAQAPTAYVSRASKLRLQRLRVNNAAMTDADRLESARYRALILGDPCVYCGAASTAVDHIVPVVAGGGDRWDNLAPTCRECNSVKYDRPLLNALVAISERRSGAR